MVAHSNTISVVQTLASPEKTIFGNNFKVIFYLLSASGGGGNDEGVSIFLPSGLDLGQTWVVTTSSLIEADRSLRPRKRDREHLFSILNSPKFEFN